MTKDALNLIKSNKMEKLIVNNFGAIRNVEIQLKDFIVFIGETGTGKSTLAKLISIFRSSNFWQGDFRDVKLFERKLDYYQIANFLEPSTYIEYQSEKGFYFIYNEGEVSHKVYDQILKQLQSLTSIDNIENNEVSSLIKEIIRSAFKETIYIPAERGVVSFLSEKYAALDRKDLIGLFPETLLDFTGSFNQVSSIIRKQYLDLFDVTYQKENGKDYIILPNDKLLLLSESASGLQTIIPALIVFDYFSKDKSKKSYTFEEPELNLFPIAQKYLVEFLAEKVLSHGHQLIITTHSPYIPTSINNLLFASKIQTEYPKSKQKLVEVSGLNSFISSSNFAIYYLSNEEEACINLIDKDTGMIPDNDLDSASDEIMDVFDSLMSVYREFKRSNN
jgi:predicted ATPase